MASTALAIVEQVKAVDIYANNGMDPLLGKIKEHVLSFVPDVSTKKGRSEIASMAYKVAQSKTLLDNLGKELTADWKAKAKVVDEERKRMRDELDALKEQVRQPLTEFEEREKARVEDLNRRIADIRGLSSTTDADGNKLSSAQMAERLAAAKAVDIETFEEMVKDAAIAKDNAISLIEANIIRREREEAEAAELERLRKEAAEREQKEREDRIRREAEEKAKREAEEAARKERERVEAEKAEAERKVKEERERLEREKAEAEAAIIREREEAKRREEDAEQRRLADIKAAEEKAERERRELIRQQEEKERAAMLKKEAEEEAERKRQANVAHRKAVNNNILNALVQCGCSEDVGKAVIKAMIAGSVPHVSVNY